MRLNEDGESVSIMSPLNFWFEKIKALFAQGCWNSKVDKVCTFVMKPQYFNTLSIIKVKHMNIDLLRLIRNVTNFNALKKRKFC